MRLVETTWQNRNDFHGILECEHCGARQTLKTGYDDHYYHTKVIPSFECDSCKKTGQESPAQTEKEE